MEECSSSTNTEDIVICNYCERATSGVRDENCLKCTDCESVVHFSCLTTCVKGAESSLLGDVFYKFTCKSCSATGFEVVSKEKVSWLTVLVLALYNLKEFPHLSRHGFFHWKVHIADFIDRKWNYIFGSSVRRKRAWHGTVSGTLSHYSPSFFQTGTHVLKEMGWWKLTHDNVSPYNIVRLKYDSLLSSGKQSIRKNSQEEGIIEDDNNERENPSPANADSISTDLENDMLNFSDSENLDVDIDLPMDISKDEDFPQIDSELSDLVDQYVSSDIHTMSPRVLSSLVKIEDDIEMYDSERDSISSSDSDEVVVSGPPPKSLFHCREDRPLPWLKNCLSSTQESDSCVPMTEYEELQLLQTLSTSLEKSNGSKPTQILRLYRKLVVRREQRHRRLGRFSDILSSMYDVSSSSDNTCDSSNVRTLDRYQVHGLVDGKCHTMQNRPSFMLRLLGKVDPTCFVSPYTERLLKPFIRRDFHSEPLRLRLMADILRKANGNSGLTQPKRHPIDYSYVQPHHIPAINSLCELFFWPGIDLTESLLYPDFSCVALYRKIVIGFAFMVPDVSYNESYISFLFTHPEWRRAGIATFMLYHLIQTCMGKDITLHVSVTNPAVMLYQKFGFKVEELLQDFYDKYLPADSKDCKHALFLRLNR